MERRRDTDYRGERLPKDYLDIIQSVFNKNFSKSLQGKGALKECFLIFGELYPDELLVAASLKNPVNLRMITCYASLDFPPPSLKPESGSPVMAVESNSDAIQMAVNSCVDVIASFFETFFNEGRPVDYDIEYRQDWTVVEVAKTTRIYLRINRDNLELEAASDQFLEQHHALMDRAEGLEIEDDLSETESTEAEPGDSPEDSESTPQTEIPLSESEDDEETLGLKTDGDPDDIEDTDEDDNDEALPEMIQPASRKKKQFVH